MNVENGASKTKIALSVASMVASFTIIVSFLLFRRTLRHKTLMVAIFFNAICHCGEAMSSIVGEPTSGTSECYYEGIASNITILSSVMWTSTITYLLWTNMRFKTQHTKKMGRHFYITCFGLPILVTFLPFINSTYGYQRGMWRCNAIPTSFAPASSQMFWLWFSFYAWIWAPMFVCLLMTIAIFRTLVKARGTKNYELFLTTVVNYSGYPMIILLCWLPATITDTMTLVHPEVEFSDGVKDFTAAMSCSVGLLTAIYFWMTGGTLVMRVGVFPRSLTMCFVSSLSLVRAYSLLLTVIIIVITFFTDLIPYGQVVVVVRFFTFGSHVVAFVTTAFNYC